MMLKPIHKYQPDRHEHPLPVFVTRMRTKTRPIFRAPIVPERVRTIGTDGFSFFPNRFVQDGFFAALSADELSLYVLLVLVGNRQGVSCWGYDALCALLRMPLERYLVARNALITKDLIAFDGQRFQVLALPSLPPAPPSPLTSAEDFENHDPATIRQLIGMSLSGER